ncbi:hypothetical protein JAO73_00105 [Hymenobacter sp. BT523]|uniref:CsgE family curli-type amyloid fiber assembly protein n=1 Tax=Hymenobacter sp. BT523 TaxID=2795725 RepID=UPI0018EC6FA9|nr:CsgE family curli-type amyloid fiber assembly protein [Hymenobacter sp. BT523]MBJ6107392.1 hypothetical protein [Hymenobacter sp. BT523]
MRYPSCQVFQSFWGWAVAGVLMATPWEVAKAQTVGRPVREKSQAPLPSQAAPLAPQKMEEALRLLLRADSIQSLRQRATAGPESSGLVVDQTISKIGHDFYDQFFARWEAPPGNDDFTIIISERLGRGNNVLVALSVNENELLEFPLQAKYDLIEEAAQQAIEIASGFLQQSYNISRQLEKGNKQPLDTY